MIEETLQELVNAVDNLRDQKISFKEETEITLDWMGNSLDTMALRSIAISSSLEDIANILKKIEAKMK